MKLYVVLAIAGLATCLAFEPLLRRKNLPLMSKTASKL